MSNEYTTLKELAKPSSSMMSSSLIQNIAISHIIQYDLREDTSLSKSTFDCFDPDYRNEGVCLKISKARAPRA